MSSYELEKHTMRIRAEVVDFGCQFVPVLVVAHHGFLDSPLGSSVGREALAIETFGGSATELREFARISG